MSDQTRTSHNGRLAYLQLKNHYLGPAHRGTIKSDADKVPKTAYLEDYCGKLKRAYTDLADCQDVVSDDRKIRIFLEGLRCPEVTAARSQVLATEQLNASVDAAMEYVCLVKQWRVADIGGQWASDDDDGKSETFDKSN